MDVFEKIDSLVKSPKTIVTHNKRRTQIALYAEGLKNKLTEANFAISKLQQLKGRSDTLQTDTAEAASIEDRRYFYSDAFWAFLYASLDVLAQLVNQALNIGLPEDKTDFKKLDGKLQSNEHKGKKVAKLFQQCLKTYDFKRLDKFRNCVLHRRHTYFSEKFLGDRGSRGYTTIGETQRAVHYLCDDPYTITPSIYYKREIPDFMEKMQSKIMFNIEQILDAIKLVK